MPRQSGRRGKRGDVIDSQQSDRRGSPLGTAVVTGGCGGLGEGIVRRLVADGWHVVVLDRAPGSAEQHVPVHEVDVTDRPAVLDAFELLDRRYPPIALLVNAAGVQAHMDLEAEDPGDWYRVIDVNLHGTFNCMQAAGRRMLESGHGCVVNISSIAAERGGVRRGPYCASKAAVNALTRVAAVEWGPRKVRVNAVGPGYCDTPMLAAALHGGDFSEADVVSRVPLGRLGSSEDVAAAVAFLASPQAAYVNGQVLYVDGGFLVDYAMTAGPVPSVRPSRGG